MAVLVVLRLAVTKRLRFPRPKLGYDHLGSSSTLPLNSFVELVLGYPRFAIVLGEIEGPRSVHLRSHPLCHRRLLVGEYERVVWIRL